MRLSPSRTLSWIVAFDAGVGLVLRAPEHVEPLVQALSEVDSQPSESRTNARSGINVCFSRGFGGHWQAETLSGASTHGPAGPACTWAGQGGGGGVGGNRFHASL